ncbi:Ig-like domain-containing protein [Shewanella sp. D64]|uniref:Ig-like domain-containing protein n=1 Tax=unclassified Shewanella TaxID=196818 RepID=UPI0022BA54C6|nr:MULTISPECIES: Ig-like domain-containing protein [unclassified Shewanella]MEC4727344.1 Ig-like domain-containing protein [Shewanella sp. D64]MEC4739499.1 Ig-like domain-containing protein [Shewanella sp. E94]WBJ96826.1 Ig-like domain-containing protein [Shewanella sp. MTB7]
MSLIKSMCSSAFLFLMFLLSGCGGDNNGFPTGECGGPDNPCPAYAVSLQVLPQVQTLAVSTHEPYRAIAIYSDGAKKEVTSEVIWSSSVSAVASIGEQGDAEALAAGTTEISASLPQSQAGPAVSDTAMLRVTDAELLALNIEPGQGETLVGLNLSFKAIALFADSHQQDVTREVSWNTSDVSVASISNQAQTQGVATGIKAGSTLVNTQFMGMDAQAVLIVLNSQVERLVISPVDSDFPVGTSQQYRADLIFENGLSMEVSEQSQWSSSQTHVATFTDVGILTGEQTGTTQVSASLHFADIALSDSTSAIITQAEVTQLVVSPAQVSYPVGTQGDYTAVAYYSDGATVDVTRDAIWSVDDESVVIIDGSGEQGGHATALAPGSVTVTALFQGVSGAANADVTNAVIESIEITPLNIMTPAGTDVTYTARARFSDLSVHDISLLGYWQSSNAQIATIEITGALAGKAHGLTAGETDISIDYMGMTQSTLLTVTDASLSSLQVTPKNLSEPLGTHGQYRATAYYTDGHSQDVTREATWSSQHSEIVSIIPSGDEAGIAKANTVGVTRISAIYGGFVSTSGDRNSLNINSQGLQTQSVNDSTQATVTDAQLVQLNLSPLTASISAGNSQAYTLSGIFSDGSSKELTEFAKWQVVDSSVASIDAAGTAHGKRSGTTKVLATYLGSQLEAELIVTDAVIETLQVSPGQNQLPVGQSQSLTATAFYSDGHKSDVTHLASWSSNSLSIIEVVSSGSEAGFAQAISEGDAKVTASFNGMQAVSDFVVTNAILESVSLSPITASIAAGNTLQYQFTGFFSDGSHQDLTHVSSWQSSQGSVASIDRHGLAQSYIKGPTLITASYIGFNGTAVLDVTDASLIGLQVTPANSFVPLGTSGQYIATAFYSDGHSSDVTQFATWTAVDNTIVNIVATGTTGGLAQAIGVGSTQVQANFGTAADAVDIMVTDASLVELIVSPANASIAVGVEQEYTATGIFSDGNSKDLTRASFWTSSDVGIASINHTGIATSYLPSEVHVTARYIGFTATAELTVTPAELSYIQVTPVDIKVPKGTEGQFEARAYYTDNRSEDITLLASWTSVNEEIVHVGTGSVYGGFASALNLGSTQVDAQFNGMSSTANVEVTAAELLELTVTPVDASVAAGLTQSYQAFARFSDGTSKEVTLSSSWQSSDTDIATIDAKGIAYTLYSGSTVIQASYKTLTAKARLAVDEAVLVELQLTPVTSKININEMQQYIATAFYSDGYAVDVSKVTTWTVVDANIAHVITSGITAGRVTGIAEGSSQVNAHYYGLDAQAEVIVTELEYLGINVEPADSHVIVNETTQMQALAVYRDSGGMIIQKDVTDQSFWSVEMRDKISINATGLVTGLKEGESAVYALFQGFEGEGRLNVLDSEVLSIKVTPNNLEVPVGTKGRYKATATMYNYAEVDVTYKATWSSSDPDVIHIVTTGIFGGTGTANALGVSQITAEYQKSSSTVTTRVTDPILESITITPNDDVIYTQSIFQFTAMANYSDNTSVDVTLDASWKSDNPGNIQVQTGSSRAGEVISYDVGVSATISVSYQGKEDARLVTVQENGVAKIEVKPTDIMLAVGAFQVVEVWVTFNDGTSFDYADYVEWSSSDANVATGIKDIINGHKIGSAVLTATFDGHSGSASVEIIPAN